MLVDPRPYTYEYRTPRYNNPTFLSNNLYDSLYMRSSRPNDYFPPNEQKHISNYNNPEQNNTLVKQRNYSMDLNTVKKTNLTSEKPIRQDQGFKLPSIHQKEEKEFIQPQSNINESRVSKGGSYRRGFERFRIYQSQQKPYDIVKNIPKAYESNRLRNWPKFSLEHKLREKGIFHNYDKEDL